MHSVSAILKRLKVLHLYSFVHLESLKLIKDLIDGAGLAFLIINHKLMLSVIDIDVSGFRVIYQVNLALESEVELVLISDRQMTIMMII